MLITGRTNDKQTIFDKNYIKLFCREVQETNEHSNKECLGLKSHLSIPSEINLTGVLSTNREWTKTLYYNEEFDPGSGWTLATGLTHASRGAAMKKACFLQAATGARVSNAYRTCLILRNSLAKVRLMPDVIRISHDVLIKDLSVWDGDASH